MAQQLEITKFFPYRRRMSTPASRDRDSPGPAGPSPAETPTHKRIAVRPLNDLCKTPTKSSPSKIKCLPKVRTSSKERACRVPPTPAHEIETVCLLSSDDDSQNFEPSPRFKMALKSSKPSNQFKGSTALRSPNKQPSNSSIAPSPLTPNKAASKPATPKSIEKSPPNKFYSPSKKRSVKKATPKSPRTPSTNTITPRRLFVSGDDTYSKVCMGQDDKTIFLLNIVKSFVDDESLSYILGSEACTLLWNYMRLCREAIRLVCRLYWRKNRWYRREELLRIISQKDLENNNSNAMFLDLIEKGFLLEGTEQNMTIEDFRDGHHLLKLDDLSKVCKHFNIKKQSRKDSFKSLLTYCRSTSTINSYFTNNTASTQITNAHRVLQVLREKVGLCYKLTEKCRDVLYKLHLISYLGIDYEIIRKNQLELELLNVKTKKVVFPVDETMKLDKPNIVFPTQHSFENYMMAHFIHEDFIATECSAKKKSIIRQAYHLYLDLQKDNNMEQYLSLPVWLRKYSPGYLYVKIIEEGISELKKGKDPVCCQLAVTMLTTLLGQEIFRQHRRANWYDEKSLILLNYLHQVDEAANVLLEGLLSNLSEEAKDVLRPRAKKMSNQKNINLNDNIRAMLRAHGTKDYILESSLPNVCYHKSPMENITKGKIMFESRSADGKTIQSVENTAISCYLELGEFTNGQHWEGRIVTTIFFLLFWDIIYSKPVNAVGIFLCHLQKYPLDMFSESFYQARKKPFDDRLQLVESAPIEELIQLMKSTWSSRPEGEQSGICRELGWDNVYEVSVCLGSKALAALSRRLAQDYRYAHSGFPDLTLWNFALKKVKFAEVKSDSDKPSMKQIQWMQYLLAHNVDTELCYVGTKGLHKTVRQSAINLLQELD